MSVSSPLSRGWRPGIATPQVLQLEATQVLVVALGQPVAGTKKHLEPVGAG